MRGLLSVRFLFACMSFLGISVVQMMRFNISVAMAIMAGSRQHNISGAVPGQTTYGENTSNVELKRKEIHAAEEADFNWSIHTQELLLAAFYIGYTVGNIPAGWLADRYGGKWIIFGGAIGSAILNILGPFTARSSVELFFATRCLSGVSEGFIIPSLNTMVNNWTPVDEKTRMMTFIVAGFAFGPAVGQSLSGIICSSLGWAASFYILGSLTITWSFLWAVTSSDEPRHHPIISKKERDYIETRRSARLNDTKFPIRSMLLSMPVIAYTVLMFAIPGFVFFNLASNLPLYFKHVLGFDILSVGFLTSIPYICQWMASLIASIVADSLIGRKIMRTTPVRKLTVMIGSGIMTMCFFLRSFGVITDRAMIVILIATMYGAMGIVVSAVFTNALDIAPSYAGTVTGISNAIAVTSGFIGPLVSAIFIEDQADPHGWRTVFLITAAVTILGALFFLAFGSGEVQSWALAEINENKMYTMVENCNQEIILRKDEDSKTLMEDTTYSQD